MAQDGLYPPGASSEGSDRPSNQDEVPTYSPNQDFSDAANAEALKAMTEIIDARFYTEYASDAEAATAVNEAANDWYDAHWPGRRELTDLDDTEIPAALKEVSETYMETEVRLRIIMGTATEEDLQSHARKRTDSPSGLLTREVESLQKQSGSISQAYLDAAESLRECLDAMPRRVQNLESAFVNLQGMSERIFGTTFSDTISQPNLSIASRPDLMYPELTDEDVPLSIRDASHRMVAAVELGKMTPVDALYDRKPYNRIIADTDRSKLPYPNYPPRVASTPVEIDDRQVAGWKYTMVLEYVADGFELFVPGETLTDHARLIDDVSEYPIGYATAIASGLAGLKQTLELLKTAPTYADYEASADSSDYENTVYRGAPIIDQVGRRETKDLGFDVELGSFMSKRTAGLSGVNEIPVFSGIVRPATDIGTQNLEAIASLFRPIDPEFADKITSFKDAYDQIATEMAAAIGCQFKNFAKDAMTDDFVDALLTGIEPLDPSQYPRFTARREALQASLDLLRRDLQLTNVAQQADQIRDSTDKRNVLFKEQCFFLNYINIFLNQKIKEDGEKNNKKRLPYVALPATGSWKAVGAANASLLVGGDAYGFLNKMTLSPKLKHLVNIENSQLSLLQPSIRLYKVVYDEFGNDDYQVEMKFDSHFTANDLTNFTSDAGSRGSGAGIKSFVFSYEGSNPFSVKKSIKANLKIFGSNFRELVRDRRSSYVRLDSDASTGSRNYKYTDLALKTGRAHHVGSANPTGCGDTQDLREQNENLADLNFRLRAEVGYAPIDNHAAALIGPDALAAIRNSFVTLNLTPTVHNFDFDETGQVVMNINYLAYIEEFFDNKNFNIFASAEVDKASRPDLKDTVSPLVTIERLKLSLALDAVSKKCGDESSNIVSEIKEDFKKHVALNQRDALSWLIKCLMDGNNIHYLTMPYTNLQSYLLTNDATAMNEVQRLVNTRGSYAAAQTDLKDSIDRGLAEFANQKGEASDDDTSDDEIAAALLSSPATGETVSYFFLGRLIDIILINIDKELQALSDNGGSGALMNIREVPLANGSKVEITSAARIQQRKQFQIALDNFKRMRIVLGPVEFANSPSRSSSAITNATFGDIPVSVKYFIEYMTEKMLQKEDTFYSLTKFLNDIMNEFVRDFLNSRECFRNMKTKVRAQQASLCSWSPSSDYDVLSMKIAQTGLEREQSVLRDPQTLMPLTTKKRARVPDLQLVSGREPLLYLSGPPGARTSIPPDHEFNYFVYFAGQIQPIEKMKGKRHDYMEDGVRVPGDESRGIFHYLLGRPRGLIKNISLSKTQTRGLAEVRFEQDGYDGLRQLRVVYDVEIDSYANINTYPGTYIYVDPAGFDPGYNIDKITLTELGIGGYYMIIRSEHEFGPGKANTKITAKWVNQIEAEAELQESCRSTRDTSTGTNDTSRRCANYSEDRADAAAGSPDERNIVTRFVDNNITPWDGWVPWY